MGFRRSEEDCHRGCSDSRGNGGGRRYPEGRRPAGVIAHIRDRRQIDAGRGPQLIRPGDPRRDPRSRLGRVRVYGMVPRPRADNFLRVAYRWLTEESSGDFILYASWIPACGAHHYLRDGGGSRLRAIRNRSSGASALRCPYPPEGGYTFAMILGLRARGLDRGYQQGRL